MLVFLNFPHWTRPHGITPLPGRSGRYGLADFTVLASALPVDFIKALRGNRHYCPAPLFPQLPHPSPTSIHLQLIGNGGAVWPNIGLSLISLLAHFAYFASFPNSESPIIPTKPGASNTFYADNGAASASLLSFHRFSR